MELPAIKIGTGLRFGALPVSRFSLQHRPRHSSVVRFKPQGGTEYYSILGLTPDCTADEIKAKYRAMQKKCHPDISGDQELSALVNEAYKTLSDPTMKASYDRQLNQYRLSHPRELVRMPSSGSGVLGPMQPGDVLCTKIVKVDKNNDMAKEGRRLLVWLREWAKTFMFSSDLPLPMPVQCDDIEGGVRLAVISTKDNVIQSAGELLFTISPTKDNKSWSVEARRISIIRPGPIPGEDRLMQAFTDAMRDKSTPGAKKKESLFELSGVAAAAFAQLMPALIPLPIGQPEGASYEAYHLKHSEDHLD